MSINTGAKERVLRDRVKWFLCSKRYGRDQVSAFIEEVSNVGEIAIFGGMLRDLLLIGNKNFSSDIDLVIHNDEYTRLETILARYQPYKNAFGGYRIRLEKWLIDIWPLSWTWAFKMGYVNGENLSDLTRTTFFNWDAIVCEVTSGSIHTLPNYFEDLENNMVRINLAANPKPEGVALRTIRLLLERRAKLSYELAEYVADVLETINFESVCATPGSKNRKWHPYFVAAEGFLDQFNKMRSDGCEGPISLPDKQLSFGFLRDRSSISVGPRFKS